jgi:hypothetical protein
MRSKITRIWTLWLLGMAIFAAVTWAMFQVALPGFSSGTPSLDDMLGYFADIGVWGTIKIFVVLFGAPIVATYIEIRKARRDQGFDA